MPRLLMVATIPIALRGFLLPHVRYFRDRGWKVDGAASGIRGEIECVRAFHQVWDVDWSRQPFDLINMLRASRQIERIVADEAYDIVHVHTPIAAFVTRYALRRLRRRGFPKVIYTAHGFHFHDGGSRFNNWAIASLERLAGRWTDYLVVINREDECAAKKYRIVPEDRIRYMPGIGVDRCKYSSEAVSVTEIEALRRELGIGNCPLLLQIAEFNPGKRHADLLRAFSQLRTPAHLAFAGSGPLMESMRALAADLRVADRLHFLGFRPDIPVLIRASRATILASEREGLPRSVMESLCLGVPVIGSDVRGVRELISGGAGLSFKPGDIEGLARAMTQLLEDPAAAREMGARGREKMSRYDLGCVLRLHEELYYDAVKDTGVVDARC